MNDQYLNGTFSIEKDLQVKATHKDRKEVGGGGGGGGGVRESGVGGLGVTMPCT